MCKLSAPTPIPQMAFLMVSAIEYDCKRNRGSFRSKWSQFMIPFKEQGVFFQRCWRYKHKGMDFPSYFLKQIRVLQHDVGRIYETVKMLSDPFARMIPLDL